MHRRSHRRAETARTPSRQPLPTRAEPRKAAAEAARRERPPPAPRVRASRPAEPPAEPAPKGSLLSRALLAVDMPADLAEGLPHLELTGNRELVVEGCKSVLECDEGVVRLATGKFSVRIMGRGLVIRALTDTTAIVEGFILSVDFTQ